MSVKESYLLRKYKHGCLSECFLDVDEQSFHTSESHPVSTSNPLMSPLHHRKQTAFAPKQAFVDRPSLSHIGVAVV